MNQIYLALATILTLSIMQAQDDSTRAVEWGYLDSTAESIILTIFPTLDQ